ncbi:MAG: class F sortase [Anaerolineae bacterium]|nr:class F sortase [Anaerolineae bacterium]
MTGCITILVAVITFAVYQMVQTTSHDVAIATLIPLTAVPTSNLTATPTPHPATLRITAEKASLVAIIIRVYFGKTDDWDVSYLNEYAGHLQGTAEIGQGGNVVLAGHVELKDGRQGPFANIGRLTNGDPIAIVSDAPGNPVVMRYRVTEVRVVDPQDLNTIRNHGYEELTLVTCQDWSEKTHTYNKRLIVHARPTA